MKKKWITLVGIGLFSSAMFLAPANIWASNNRDTTKIAPCIKNSAAPQFLTCNDLDVLDIK